MQIKNRTEWIKSFLAAAAEVVASFPFLVGEKNWRLIHASLIFCHVAHSHATQHLLLPPRVTIWLRPKPIVLSRSPAQIKRICYTTNSFFSKRYYFLYGLLFCTWVYFFPREVDPMRSRVYSFVRGMNYTPKVYKSFHFYIKKNYFIYVWLQLFFLVMKVWL